MIESSTFPLLCDEELLPSSPSCPPASSPRRGFYCLSSPTPGRDDNVDEDCDDAFQNYMQRESVYAPQSGYAERLQVSTHLSTSRFQAIRWIFLACGRLNLGFVTAFNAVNYLDRFVSMNCCKEWEGWMMELLSIACLSIASKYEEVVLPSFHDFQTEDMEHSFQLRTIQRMELTVLKALDWRLSCVTPYSYVDLLACRMRSLGSHLPARTTELLIRALLDTRFIEYDASAIVAAALRCGLKELRPRPGTDAFLSIFIGLIPNEYLGTVDKCHKTMEDHIVGPLSACVKNYGCPSSPVTVIPKRRTAVYDSYVDIDGSFSNAYSLHFSGNKRKREEESSLCQ